MKTIQFVVPDMACGHCAKTVEGALRGVAGVDDVDVSLDDKTVRVTSTDVTAEADLQDAVREAGYTVAG